MNKCCCKEKLTDTADSSEYTMFFDEPFFILPGIYFEKCGKSVFNAKEQIGQQIY